MSVFTAWWPRRLREIVSYRAGRADRALAERAGQVIILAYHNVRPTGAPAYGERTIHVAQRDLARQLDVLQETHEVRSLADLEPWKPTGPRPVAIITFDDGYRGALTAGVEELTRRGLPATFFVVPGHLGDRGFWWDRLAGRYGGMIPTDVRRHVLDVLGGKEEAIWRWAGGSASDAAPPEYARTVSETELTWAAAQPGITLAPHTWTHPVLTALPPDLVGEELGRSRTWMRAHFPDSLSWISFPFGRSSPAVMAAARQAGFLGGLMIGEALAWVEHPGALSVEARFRVPRLNVPAEASLERFALTVSGAWGV